MTGSKRIEIDFVIPIYLDELDKLKLSEDLSEFKTITDIENLIEVLWFFLHFKKSIQFRIRERYI